MPKLLGTYASCIGSRQHTMARALHEHVWYLCVRERFIAQAGLPKHFNFAHYLRLAAAHFINELVEIDPPTPTHAESPPARTAAALSLFQMKSQSGLVPVMASMP